MRNSVSAPTFDSHAVTGQTPGELDRLEYVDALPELIPHPRPHRVPLGAPVVAGGWAVAADGSAPGTVVVVLDGARAYPAETGISRGDIAAVRPGTPEQTGYRAVIPTGDLLPGGHELRAYALDADGWHEAGYRPFWLAGVPLTELDRVPRRLRVRVEQVVDLAPDGALLGFDVPVPLGRYALLTGWAVDPGARSGVAGVVAFGPRGGRWSAPCDVLRADLRGVLDLTGDRIGFELAVPTADLGRGRHVVHVAGFDGDGRLFEGDVAVTLDVAGPARPFPAFPRRRPGEAPAAAEVTELNGSDEPRRAARGPVVLARGSVATVEGWALDRDGRGAATVFVMLAPQDAGVPPHRYAALAGYRRDEWPRTLPSPPVEDGWFAARIDTAHLPPRAYAMSLAVVDRDRRTYTCRELGSVTVVDDGSAGGAARRT